MKHNPNDFQGGLSKDDPLLRLGIDLDGTLAESIWPQPGIGKPIWKVVKWARKMAADGYKIIIFTARADAEFKDIAKWCRTYGVPFVWIYTGKPLMKYYLDDKNIKLEDIDEEV
jgi:hydroxymethylpyrimidine pyrophosphatase-like HAD family hydrolase